MTSTIIYKQIPPTYLCIKQHSITGLKYFCKTTRPDPYTYKGSGVYWTTHINKHGKQYVETLWLSELYYDTSIVEHALQFSYENDIVKSNDWANQKIENGLDGGSKKGRITSDETKAKMSAAKKGKKVSTETKDKISNTRLNKTPEEKAFSKQKELDTKNSRTPEEKAITKKNMSDGHTNRSLEEKVITKKKMSDKAKGKTKTPFISIIETRKTYAKCNVSKYFPEFKQYY